MSYDYFCSNTGNLSDVRRPKGDTMKEDTIIRHMQNMDHTR